KVVSRVLVFKACIPLSKAISTMFGSSCSAIQLINSSNGNSSVFFVCGEYLYIRFDKISTKYKLLIRSSQMGPSPKNNGVANTSCNITILYRSIQNCCNFWYKRMDYRKEKMDFFAKLGTQ